MSDKKWKDLGVKDKLALFTATCSFFLGFVLLFTGMFIGEVGQISSGVLTGFGSALIYAASIFGVSLYFRHADTEIHQRFMNDLESVVGKNKDK